MNRKIILFELNEVPYRIFDHFARADRLSRLSTLLPVSRQYITVSEDIGHLSPWKTWPSLHRGVNDAKHLINDFGEDLREVDRAYPPIWKLLTPHNVRVGIFGTLHTYPPPPSFDNYSFYMPDTFAAGSECFPKTVEAFQAFNLGMARKSARNVDARIPWTGALKLLRSLPDLGFRTDTLARVGGQLLAEKAAPWKVVRRRTYQSVLAFDVFMRQLDRERPDFVSFFTNHVASAMHRYWAAAFPDDYDHFEIDAEWVRTYGSEIRFAMTRADAMVSRLARFVDQNDDYVLWIATSMGQEAHEAKTLETQLYIDDLSRFMARVGFASDDWDQVPSMLPQVNVVLRRGKGTEFKRRLDTLVVDGNPLSYREKDGGFFSLDFGHKNLHGKPEYVHLVGERVAFDELGLRNVEIQDKSGTTAYHIPRGCLFVYDPRDRNPDNGRVRTEISALDIAPSILNNYNIRPPTYMNCTALSLM